MLSQKKILLGISGSIAAYKAAMLVRLLIKAGAEVQVVMTEAATDFITPLTLATLSKKPVYTQFVKDETGQWNNHVELGLWADAMLIAPASANTLAKAAHGLCDNLLTAVYLSARCPVLFAPAMDLDMYAHPSTQANIRILQGYGHTIIDAENGELASGLSGQGRMAEPEHIVDFLQGFFARSSKFDGKKVLITAGPTYEAIDPVRFIGNHSSGKMGYALAEHFASQGARVTLVSGPCQLSVTNPNICLQNVVSAEEMFGQAEQAFETADITILAAAVADYRPQNVAHQKIKKSADDMQIALTKTVDIAASLGKHKKTGQLLVGFALETDNELANAQDKLLRKNLDFIVLNSLNDSGAGFQHNTNKVTIVDKNNKITPFELKSKDLVAQDIINYIINNYY